MNQCTSLKTDYLISKAFFNSLFNLKVFRFAICPAKVITAFPFNYYLLNASYNSFEFLIFVELNLWENIKWGIILRISLSSTYAKQK